MKKLLTLLLALAASVGTLFAQSGTCGNNLTWDLTDGVLTTSGTGDMTNWFANSNAPWYSYREEITDVIIDNGVTAIGSYAFYNCTSLTSVTIGNSVTSIEELAFISCSGLTSITCNAVVPPICGGYVFYGVDKSIPLYVPDNSVEAYQSADGWREFYNIIGQSNAPTAIEEVNTTTNLNCSRKLLQDGQILILRGDRTYTITGKQIK